MSHLDCATGTPLVQARCPVHTHAAARHPIERTLYNSIPPLQHAQRRITIPANSRQQTLSSLARPHRQLRGPGTAAPAPCRLRPHVPVPYHAPPPSNPCLAYLLPHVPVSCAATAAPWPHVPPAPTGTLLIPLSISSRPSARDAPPLPTQRRRALLWPQCCPRPLLTSCASANTKLTTSLPIPQCLNELRMT